VSTKGNAAFCQRDRLAINGRIGIALTSQLANGLEDFDVWRIRRPAEFSDAMQRRHAAHCPIPRNRKVDFHSRLQARLGRHSRGSRLVVSRFAKEGCLLARSVANSAVFRAKLRDFFATHGRSIDVPNTTSQP
jgi:hypothetical protein